eukprot:5954821-Pyramimonas_sp.AAC.1
MVVGAWEGRVVEGAACGIYKKSFTCFIGRDSLLGRFPPVPRSPPQGPLKIQNSPRLPEGTVQVHLETTNLNLRTTRLH